MKKIIGRFLAISGIGLLMLTSCKKNDTIVTATSGKAGTLSATSTSITLSKANDTSSSAIVAFNFTAANYGYSAAITNTLEIDNAADNWAKPVSITLGANSKTYSYTTAQLNTLALGFKIGPDTAGQLLARIVHTISSTITPIYSNTITFTVTPYSTVIPASYWYVPGSYEGWGTTTADSLRAPAGSTIFTGVIPLTGDLNFKLVPTKAGFTGNLGDAGGGTTTNYVYTTTLSGSGGNIVGVSEPTIDPAVNITTNLMTFDASKNTLTLTPDQWAVVGSATAGSWPNSTGPQSDVDMKFNNGTQVWSVILPLSGGNQIKFRQNHAWSLNYGGDAGVLASGGDNINITDTGTYLVTLDFVHNTYSVVKQ
jgi:starch-binding outer membrane protein SusE/F